MKEPASVDIPSRGHVYTAEEVLVRLSLLEDGMKDLRTLGYIRPRFSGISGYSGIPGYQSSSGCSGDSKIPQDRQFEVKYELNPHEDSYDEGFVAKGIRELKEYFQALFVKTHNKKEIEHGK